MYRLLNQRPWLRKSLLNHDTVLCFLPLEDKKIFFKKKESLLLFTALETFSSGIVPDSTLSLSGAVFSRA